MRLPEIGPTASQIAELDQRVAQLAALGRLLGAFRESLMEAGYSGDESFIFASRLFDASINSGHQAEDEES